MKLNHLWLRALVLGLVVFPWLRVDISRSAPPNNTDSPSQDKALSKQSWDFSQNIYHQFVGSRIITQFAPKNPQGENVSLSKLAESLGYDHFNWTSYVEHDPYGIADQSGQTLATPYNDPPRGGYQYDAADELPFYWDMVSCERCNPRHHFLNANNVNQFELVFEDSPADYRLQPGEKITFVTHLVGVKYFDVYSREAEWDVLHSFRWQLANPAPHLSRVSMLEANIPLHQLSPLLWSKMQLDGAQLSR